MTVRDLAYKCKDIEIDCDECDYKEKCERLTEELENISPYGLLIILDKNLD